MGGTGDHYVIWSKPGSESQKWKIKNKCMHKYKHKHIWHICNSGTLNETVNHIKIILSEDGIVKCTESYWIGCSKKRLRESSTGINLTEVQYIHDWNIMVKSFEQWIHILKMKDSNIKQVKWGYIQNGEVRVNGEEEGGLIWFMYFLYLHENS
jgi:hypothetical protein